MENEPPVATTRGGNVAFPENWKREHVIKESPVISIVELDAVPQLYSADVAICAPSNTTRALSPGM